MRSRILRSSDGAPQSSIAATAGCVASKLPDLSALLVVRTIDLRDITSSGDTHSDVDHGESRESEQQHGLEHLVLHSLRSHQLNGSTIKLDEAATALHISDGNSSFLKTERKRSSKQQTAMRAQSQQQQRRQMNSIDGIGVAATSREEQHSISREESSGSSRMMKQRWQQSQSPAREQRRCRRASVSAQPRVEARCRASHAAALCVCVYLSAERLNGIHHFQ